MGAVLRQRVLALPPQGLRTAVVEGLLRAYHKDDPQLMALAVARLCNHYGAVFPRMRAAKGKELGRALAHTETRSGAIIYRSPEEWKRGDMGRFAHALEWAKTIIHEVMHSILARNEEKLVRQFEGDFTDDLIFNGKVIVEGVDSPE